MECSAVCSGVVLRRVDSAILPAVFVRHTDAVTGIDTQRGHVQSELDANYPLLARADTTSVRAKSFPLNNSASFAERASP
jgi:hypothetical protein